MAAPPLEAFFRTASDGLPRLYLHHTPPVGMRVQGAVVYVHPWAEEMNKSRRMAAMASRALAADGWAVLQPDLFGCGDSGGDFGDARWAVWVQDVADAARWLLDRHGKVPLWLWGLRTGALLAAAAREQLDEPSSLLLWQPVQQGKLVLQQFLRLKAAAQLADGGGKAVLEAARRDLAAGRPVVVAGYALAAELAHAMESARLEPDTRRPGQLVWRELSTAANAGLSPAAAASAPKWEAAGWAVDAASVPGPAFWQTMEIVDAPALVRSTLSALSSVRELAV